MTPIFQEAGGEIRFSHFNYKSAFAYRGTPKKERKGKLPEIFHRVKDGTQIKKIRSLFKGHRI